MRCFHAVWFVLLLLSSPFSLAERQQDVWRIVAPIHHFDDPGTNNYFFARLLELVLEKTVSSHGPYQLIEPEMFLVDHRLRAALAQGKVDVGWFHTSPDYERELLAIEEPLLGDINNYRVLLIRRGEQERFNEVRSLADLRRFTGGVGAQWVDLVVMDANDLPYTTANSYALLFRMLAAGRFDYFSRGLYQVEAEVHRFAELDLVIEENLMLHYPGTHYFFVARDNKALAERILHGIQLAREDGSYEALMNSLSQFRWAKAVLGSNTRRILELQHPYFPSELQ